jgi:acetoin utilization deacetylase AcuC-like enzyme
MSPSALHQPLATIPVFFCDAMQAHVESLSPSAHKPLAAVQSWLALGIPLSVIPPKPVTREELARAHDRKHVDAILECRTMNGFYTRAADVAASLPYTSGAMLAAAREALRNGQVAVAPTCGFHHARHAKADAFCTFNGLMVTALALKDEGLAQRVGILDLDQHYGDGTEEIITTLGVDFVNHYSSAEEYNWPAQAEEFLARVPSLVAGMKNCDVVLYQAGADPHVDDPLGGWLTTDQLAERDRLVFQTARELRIPVAWNLAGGYQKPLRKVLDIHDNTMRVCSSAYPSASREGLGNSLVLGPGSPGSARRCKLTVLNWNVCLAQRASTTSEGSIGRGYRSSGGACPDERRHGLWLGKDAGWHADCRIGQPNLDA